MHRRALLALASSSLAVMILGHTAARADEYRVSGPVVHENLAIYLVHGKSAAGAVPLTLDEALRKGAVKVHETGTSASCRSRTSARMKCSSRPATS